MSVKIFLSAHSSPKVRNDAHDYGNKDTHANGKSDGQRGRITNPLFISTILFNPFVDSYTFSPMIFQTYLGQGTFPVYATDQGVVGDSGWNNSISYATPDFGSLTGTLQYASGNASGEAGAHKDSAQVFYFKDR